MQAAALQLARGASCDEVGRTIGVAGETIRRWTKLPEWGKYWELAQTAATVQAVRSNIIQLHPDRIDTAASRPVVAPESGELVDHAIEVLRSALEQGDVRAATWVLERVDPERFGTPKDRQVMAELRKTAAVSKSGPVIVTIETPAERKAAGSA